MPTTGPNPPTVQEQIQSELQQRLANFDKYSPDEQGVIRQLADRYGVAIPHKPLDQNESAFPFLGNALDQLGSNVSGGVQGVKDIWNTLTQKGDSRNPLQGPVNVAKMVGGMVQGAGQQLGAEQSQAKQEIQGGNPLWGALRGLVGGVVPVVGPDTMNVLDQSFGRGKYQGKPDPGGAITNALTMGAQYGGPEIIKALGAPERGLGKILYEGRQGGKGAFDFGEATPLRERPEITGLGKELQMPGSSISGLPLAGVKGQKAIDFLGSHDKPDTFLGQQEEGIQKGIQSHKTEMLDQSKVLGPLQDEIASIDPRIASPRRAALQAELEKFKSANGWKPATATKPGKPMDPITVEDGQTMKRSIYRLNSESLYGDTEALPPAEKAAKVLQARGLMDAINDKAPEVAEFNKRMHTGIQLQDQLIQAQKQYPGFMKNWLKYMAGTPAILGMTGEGFAASTGHPLAGVLPMTGIIAAKAATDPFVASRIGLALQHAGSDPISLSLGLTPGVARAGQMLGPQTQPSNSQ
jgi:hypothetical protein